MFYSTKLLSQHFSENNTIRLLIFAIISTLLNIIYLTVS